MFPGQHLLNYVADAVFQALVLSIFVALLITPLFIDDLTQNLANLNITQRIARCLTGADEASSYEEQRITLVLIDDASISQIKRTDDFRSYLGRLVNRIQQFRPQVIGVNIFLQPPVLQSGEQGSAGSSADMAALSTSNVVLASRMSKLHAHYSELAPDPAIAGERPTTGPPRWGFFDQVWDVDLQEFRRLQLAVLSTDADRERATFPSFALAVNAARLSMTAEAFLAQWFPGFAEDAPNVGSIKIRYTPVKDTFNLVFSSWLAGDDNDLSLAEDGAIEKDLSDLSIRSFIEGNVVIVGEMNSLTRMFKTPLNQSIRIPGFGLPNIQLPGSDRYLLPGSYVQGYAVHNLMHNSYIHTDYDKYKVLLLAAVIFPFMLVVWISATVERRAAVLAALVRTTGRFTLVCGAVGAIEAAALLLIAAICLNYAQPQDLPAGSLIRWVLVFVLIAIWLDRFLRARRSNSIPTLKPLADDLGLLSHDGPDGLTRAIVLRARCRISRAPTGKESCGLDDMEAIQQSVARGLASVAVPIARIIDEGWRHNAYWLHFLHLGDDEGERKCLAGALRLALRLRKSWPCLEISIGVGDIWTAVAPTDPAARTGNGPLFDELETQPPISGIMLVDQFKRSARLVDQPGIRNMVGSAHLWTKWKVDSTCDSQQQSV
ncbi:MAG: CHASE2 domain-containing protein [Hyphomicrobiales bacterium]